MPVLTGSLAEGSVYLGQDHRVCTITILGTPTSGTMYLSHLGVSSSGVSVAGTSAAVQTAIRTIPKFANATVSGSAGGPYTVDLKNTAVVPLEASADLIGGTNAYVSITTTPRVLEWKATSFSQGSVTPLAAKSLTPGTAGERDAQIAANQHVFHSPMYLGRFNLSESEDTQRFWDGDASTWRNNQITLPGFRQRSRQNASNVDFPMRTMVEFNGALWGFHLRASNGELYKHSGTAYGWESVATYTTPSAGNYQSDAAVYRDHLYFANGGVAGGYMYINTSGTVTQVNTAANTVTGATVNTPFLSFCVMDGKLFGVRSTGHIEWTTGDEAIPTGPAGVNNWSGSVSAVYRDSGRPISLRVWRNVATGEEQIYLMASTGMYTFDLSSSTLRLAYPLNIRVHTSTDYGPVSPNANQMTVWQGDLYFIDGDQVMRDSGNGPIAIGWQTEDGLPGRGVIFDKVMRPLSLAVSARWLFCGAGQWSPADDTWGTLAQGLEDHALAYDGQGWAPCSRFTGTSNQSMSRAQALHYSQLFGPRLHASNGVQTHFRDSRAQWQQYDGIGYNNEGYLVTSWFDRNLVDIDKAWYTVDVTASNITASETIELYYQIEPGYETTAQNPSASGRNPRTEWVPLLFSSGSQAIINAAALGGNTGKIRCYFKTLDSIAGESLNAGVRSRKIRFLFWLKRAAPAATFSITSGTTALTTSAATFVADDVGRFVAVEQALEAAGTLFVSAISAYVSATAVTLKTAATNTAAATAGQLISNTPILEAATINFDAKFQARRFFDMTLDLSATQPDGRTAEAAQWDLVDLQKQVPLIYFRHDNYEGHMLSLDGWKGTYATGPSINSSTGTKAYPGIRLSERYS